jgi:hypothetical protein
MTPFKNITTPVQKTDDSVSFFFLYKKHIIEKTVRKYLLELNSCSILSYKNCRIYPQLEIITIKELP